MYKKVTAIYFSPTENTRKYVEVMAKSIESPTEILDITVNAMPLEKQFHKNELVILGTPVYVGRIPSAAKERFAAIRGDDTPCLIVVTYGNRAFDDALLELSDIAREQGFNVKGAAALIGRHTYGEIQTARPDSIDLTEASNFALKAFAKPDCSPTISIPGNHTYREGIAKGNFHPQTSENCTNCGLCIRECPVQAISEDCKTIGHSCLSCFRCIRKCPIGAKNMDTEEYRSFAAMFTEKLKNRRENQYFL